MTPEPLENENFCESSPQPSPIGISFPPLAQETEPPIPRKRHQRSSPACRTPNITPAGSAHSRLISRQPLPIFTGTALFAQAAPPPLPFPAVYWNHHMVPLSSTPKMTPSQPPNSLGYALNPVPMTGPVPPPAQLPAPVAGLVTTHLYQRTVPSAMKAKSCPSSLAKTVRNCCQPVPISWPTPPLAQALVPFCQPVLRYH